MAGGNDLKGLSEAQLVQAYVEHAQAWEATEHIGKQNRLSDRNGKIVEELKTRGVALQALQRLAGHSNAKVCSWAKSNIDWLDRPRPQVSPDPPLRRWQILWQPDNPPPRALTRDEIAQRLRRALPELCDRLVELALPAIGLWPQRSRADNPVTASRWGGMPLAPPDWQWPTVEDEPLLFIGQINCAELRGLPGAELLPPTGLLVFFGDHDAVEACRYEARADIAIYHWADIDSLIPAVAPIAPAKVYPVCPLVMRPQIDLADPHSRVVRNLKLNEEQELLYAAEWNEVRRHGIPYDADRYSSFSKLLGWPALVQWHDLDRFEDYDDARLLLQVDEYSNGEALHGWGPGGSLYFLLPKQDLLAHMLAGGEFDIQFT